jgi:hypothetical protein
MAEDGIHNFIYDLGGTNHTFFGSRPRQLELLPSTGGVFCRYQLKHGQIIRFADINARFCIRDWDGHDAVENDRLSWIERHRNDVEELHNTRIVDSVDTYASTRVYNDTVTPREELIESSPLPPPEEALRVPSSRSRPKDSQPQKPASQNQEPRTSQRSQAVFSAAPEHIEPVPEPEPVEEIKPRAKRDTAKPKKEPAKKEPKIETPTKKVVKKDAKKEPPPQEEVEQPRKRRSMASAVAEEDTPVKKVKKDVETKPRRGKEVEEPRKEVKYVSLYFANSL